MYTRVSLHVQLFKAGAVGYLTLELKFLAFVIRFNKTYQRIIHSSSKVVSIIMCHVVRVCVIVGGIRVVSYDYLNTVVICPK